MTELEEIKENGTDELEVVIEPVENDKDEIIIADEPEEKPKQQQKQAEIPIDAAVEKLKRDLEAEKQKNAAIEAEKNQAQLQLRSAKAEVDDTNIKLIDNALETVKANALNLKERLKKAHVDGDIDTFSDINTELARLAVRQDQLEQGRKAYEAKLKEPPPPADPVEALASRLTPRSANWLRSHPEFAKDTRLFNKMIAAHNLTVNDGVEADSNEYFENVERILGIKKAKEEPMANDNDDEATSAAAKPVQKRQAPPAAPVSRSAVNNSGTVPNRVTLSRAEREMAEALGQSPAEYAKNKLTLIKEGRI
jgi:hypothetical protein